MSVTYGVLYDPQAGGYNPPTIQALKRDGVEFVRVTWVDLINTVRFRVLSIRYFEKLLASKRPGVSVVKCVLGMAGLTVAPAFHGTGEYYYVVDQQSYRYCHYEPGHASVFGWFEEKIPSPNATSLSVDICPRTLLKKLVSVAAEQHTSFLAGFETEFILLKSTDPIEPVDHHDYSTASSLYADSVTSKVLAEIASSLQHGGVELQLYHAEAAPGQFEIVTGPLSPLEAADALVFTRETIKNIAHKHGLRATLAPRVFGNTCGSAAHTHVSIHSTDDGSRSDFAPTLKSYEASFLQSLLDNLPAMCAFSLPTAASYSRVADGVWSGGTYLSWGTENRETPIRLTGPPEAPRFEFRAVDGTSCPHLVLSSIIAAGLDGIRTKRKLEVADSFEAPATLTHEARSKLGITGKRLPSNLEEARKNLIESSTMKQYLGEELITKFLSVNEILQRHLSAETAELEMKKIVEYY